tara:strand:- start:116 stop:658 length:543 start_codon:yes stop_codon:yes gene_type:complete
MKYQNVRYKIRNGDVLAFRGKRWYSWLIKFRTLSRVSHVGVAIWFGDRLCCLEALEGSGVRLYPVSKYMECGDWVDWYELYDESISRKQLTDYALKSWGKRYASLWQFIRSWGIVCRRWFDKNLAPPDTNKDRFFCSEFVMSALREGGYSGEGFERPPARTSPGDVVELPCLHRMGRLVP